MEKEIHLSDSLKVSDSKIRGVVRLEREDGTVVFQKENMIVESGRRFIENKTFGDGDYASSDYKIDTIKFGTGTSLPTSSDDASTIVAEEEYSYENENEFDKIWRKNEAQPIVGTSASNDPEVVSVGSYFLNTASLTLKLGTAGVSNSWVTFTPSSGTYFYSSTNNKLYRYTTFWSEVSNAVGSNFPITTGLVNSVFFNTSDSTLYVLLYNLQIIQLTNTVGLQAKVYLRGTGIAQKNISELGLFFSNGVDDPILFSRLVFTPFPLNQNFNYNLTYDIYF
jgi:hypothetical protein